MDEREKIIEELYDVCGYLFAEYKDAPKSETESAYNRFLCVNNALNLLKEQPNWISVKTKLPHANRKIWSIQRLSLP